MPSDRTFRRLERFRRNCETVNDDDADRAVNLLTAAFPGAVVVPQPAAGVDSDEWRRADNGHLEQAIVVCVADIPKLQPGGA